MRCSSNSAQFESLIGRRPSVCSFATPLYTRRCTCLSSRRRGNLRRRAARRHLWTAASRATTRLSPPLGWRSWIPVCTPVSMQPKGDMTRTHSSHLVFRPVPQRTDVYETFLSILRSKLDSAWSLQDWRVVSVSDSVFPLQSRRRLSTRLGGETP